MDEQKHLIFTADLPALLAEGAKLLVAVDKGGAGMGLIYVVYKGRGYSAGKGGAAHLSCVRRK